MVIIIIIVVMLCGVIPLIAAILRSQTSGKEDIPHKPIIVDRVHHTEIQQSHKE